MDALKDSIKRAKEVGEGTAQKLESMSKSILGLAQSVQESIAQNNWNMMLAFIQMLQGVGFTPGLQSPYSQGQYLLALGFKSPADTPPKPLLVPAPTVIPPPTLAGVPPLRLLGLSKLLYVLLRLQTLLVRSQRPPMHTVEVLRSLLLGPSKMTRLMRLRPCRITLHPERTHFGRSHHTLHRKGVMCGRNWTLSRRLSWTRFQLCKSRLLLVTTNTRLQCSQRFIGQEHHMKLLHQFHLPTQGNKQEMVVRVKSVHMMEII
jgi:hypothetical protein